MRRLTLVVLTALLALAAATACDPDEPPVVPGTPDPFSSPGVTIDAPPVPPTTFPP